LIAWEAFSLFTVHVFVKKVVLCFILLYMYALQRMATIPPHHSLHPTYIIPLYRCGPIYCWALRCSKTSGSWRGSRASTDKTTGTTWGLGWDEEEELMNVTICFVLTLMTSVRVVFVSEEREEKKNRMSKEKRGR